MKKLVYLAVLLSLFVFTSPVAAYEHEPYDPEAVPVHPTLLKSYAGFLSARSADA